MVKITPSFPGLCCLNTPKTKTRIKINGDSNTNNTKAIMRSIPDLMNLYNLNQFVISPNFKLDFHIDRTMITRFVS